eukprot:239830_1
MKLKVGLSLNTSNILSVILYTDYDTLSYYFSKSFRKWNKNESFEQIAKRNREYFNWSKILSETVNGFGTSMNDTKISVFYHGLSLMYFHSFIAAFQSPTSTTTKLQIATIFAKGDGIIVDLNRYRGGYGCSGFLRYFNCSFVSNFANENERLFIQPPCASMYIQIESIRNMATDENYKQFVFAVSKLEQLSHEDKGAEMYHQFHTDNYPQNNKRDDSWIAILDDLANNNTKTYPKYITQCWKKYGIELDMESSKWNRFFAQYLSKKKEKKRMSLEKKRNESWIHWHSKRAWKTVDGLITKTVHELNNQ